MQIVSDILVGVLSGGLGGAICLYGFVRLHRTEVPAPEPVAAPVEEFIPVTRSADHAICSRCKNLVARHAPDEKGDSVCANCDPKPFIEQVS